MEALEKQALDLAANDARAERLRLAIEYDQEMSSGTRGSGESRRSTSMFETPWDPHNKAFGCRVVYMKVWPMS